jgi:hypothetical protein
MSLDNHSDLLNFIIEQSASGAKDWFGYPQQKIVGVYIAFALAIQHGDKFTPDEIVDYVYSLNNAVFNKLIIGQRNNGSN